jgi:hypothetical protein
MLASKQHTTALHVTKASPQPGPYSSSHQPLQQHGGGAKGTDNTQTFFHVCFCSRRAYNIENMVDIKNLKNFIMQQFVDFKYREPTWPFYLKFNLSKTIHFLKRP